MDHLEGMTDYDHNMILDYLSIGQTTIETCEDELIEVCLQYIHEHFQRKITLGKVASSLHISKNHLCQTFHEKTGYRFCEYISLQRINYAQTLIEENRKIIEYISYTCGFSSHCHFSTNFKNYVSMTSTEYRKSIKQKAEG